MLRRSRRRRRSKMRRGQRAAPGAVPRVRGIRTVGGSHGRGSGGGAGGGAGGASGGSGCDPISGRESADFSGGVYGAALKAATHEGGLAELVAEGEEAALGVVTREPEAHELRQSPRALKGREKVAADRRRAKPDTKLPGALRKTKDQQRPRRPGGSARNRYAPRWPNRWESRLVEMEARSLRGRSPRIVTWDAR